MIAAHMVKPFNKVKALEADIDFALEGNLLLHSYPVPTNRSKSSRPNFHHSPILKLLPLDRLPVLFEADCISSASGAGEQASGFRSTSDFRRRSRTHANIHQLETGQR